MKTYCRLCSFYGSSSGRWSADECRYDVLTRWHPVTGRPSTRPCYTTSQSVIALWRRHRQLLLAHWHRGDGQVRRQQRTVLCRCRAHCTRSCTQEPRHVRLSHPLTLNSGACSHVFNIGRCLLRGGPVGPVSTGPLFGLSEIFFFSKVK